MNPSNLRKNLKKLESQIDGDIFVDEINRIAYSTDASAYKEKPLGIVRPKNKNDVKRIIRFAHDHNTSIIPRTAGTSLAGQVVGGGIIVDVSRYMNKILEVNPEEKWVRVEPGVILDELNIYVKQFGLFFGPETSTSNRCMMGGMLGNNACGAHSLIYGSTRDHTLAVKTLLSDGSEVEFTSLTNEEFNSKRKPDTLEGRIYQNIYEILSKSENQEEIRKQYPDLSIKRRNTGYAIDLLLETEVFSQTNDRFNFSKLLAGSEGTLAFTTEIKLNLVPIPPPEVAVVCVHFTTLEEALQANLIALKYQPGAVELMDQTILELTKGNLEQQKNRFFVNGDPGAILIIEFARESRGEIISLTSEMEKEMKSLNLGYHFPLIFAPDTKKVWNLRKAGLGVLSNMPGDAKPVSVIEDTSVSVEQLPGYISEFKKILSKHQLECVYHAHVGTGELHLRPILNLKEQKDVEKFKAIGLDAAKLVKKYSGSLSGEHGDGRLRGEFIPLMIGDSNYQLLKEIKKTWDPNNIFNPGKIVDTPPMNSHLRYEPGTATREIETILDFSESGGYLRAAEKCNGSGDCRKTEVIGGTMCPSYMATRDENTTTRARANILRDVITNSDKKNPFNHKEIYEVLDLCLSCKACKSECPSSVDVAKLKAEFLQHYYDDNGIPLRTRIIAYISKINKLGSIFPGFTNFFLSNRVISPWLMRTLGFSPKRTMPLLYKTTLKNWSTHYFEQHQPVNPIKTVYLFNDEFTNFNDTSIGIKTIKLLHKLGYKVLIPKHLESGRTYLSKGLVRKARKIAAQNIELLENKISNEIPLIGIEPSAILTFRDEYPDLLKDKQKDTAKILAKNCFMIDEFILKEIESGHIKKDQFSLHKKHIKLHGHCQQKAIASTQPTLKILSFPSNFTVEEIPSGCCGMAGSFGYEKEHYEVAMNVGELVLFPEIRKTDNEVLIAAPGTSCRHQIYDGTKRKAWHPVEILYEALND